MKRHLALVLIISFLAIPCWAEKIQSGPTFEEDDSFTEYSFDFQVTPKLKPQVDFWTKIYSKYNSKQVVIHDKEYLQVVYTVLDFSDLENTRSRRLRRKKRKQLVKKTKEKYRRILRKLARKRYKVEQLNKEEKRVYDLFAGIKERKKFQRARSWRRIRAQTGQKDRFRKAIIRAGRYIEEMEAIFKEAGLPLELTRLPFVESFFNPHARSKCGATGMWQFMYSTGRIFMKINHIVDERKDPYIATKSAAKLLTRNYDKLGSWPLALTAYNHGALGVARGLRRTQAETLEELIENYKHRRFGFASKNFYAEFLAALEVSKNYQKYFGLLPIKQSLQFDTVEMPYYTSSKDIIKYCSLTGEGLKDLNPALRRAVRKGQNHIPKGYPLRIPVGTEQTFLTAYENIPKERKYLVQKRNIRHRVRRGESLSVIARRYRTSITNILAANNLKNRHFLRAGQYLRIPTLGVPKPLLASGETIRHRVRRGETLSKIAKRYSIRLDSILAANNLPNQHFLRAGQYLRIPGAGTTEPLLASGENIQHRVRRGDTLSKIAKRYRSSVNRIVRANNLSNRNFLHVGQKLTIPQAQLVAYQPKIKPKKVKQKAANAAKVVKTEAPPAVYAQAEAEVQLSSTPQEEIVGEVENEPATSKEIELMAEVVAQEEDIPDTPIQEITVHPHETVGHYADWVKLSARSLRRLNGLSYTQNIHVGQKLLIDYSQVTKAEFDEKRQAFQGKLEEKYLSQHKIEKVLTHTLKARQNAWYLCRYVYNVPLWLVKKYNADKNLAELKVGDKLLIPVLKEM